MSDLARRGGKSKRLSSLASSILLDSGVALVTLLCIGRDPVGRLAVIGALLEPELGDPADDRPVVARVTASAKQVKGRLSGSLARS